jgi:hypothetical protein
LYSIIALLLHFSLLWPALQRTTVYWEIAICFIVGDVRLLSLSLDSFDLSKNHEMMPSSAKSLQLLQLFGTQSKTVPNSSIATGLEVITIVKAARAATVVVLLLDGSRQMPLRDLFLNVMSNTGSVVHRDS